MSHRTMTVRLERIAACRQDLLANGIDVTRQTAAELAGLVSEHLEYFQLMLGDDSTEAQVKALIRRDLANVAAEAAGKPVPGKGAWGAGSSRTTVRTSARPGTGRNAGHGVAKRRDPERGSARRVCMAR